MNNKRPVDLTSGHWTPQRPQEFKPYRIELDNSHGTKVVGGFSSPDGKLLVLTVTNPFGTSQFQGGPPQTAPPADNPSGFCKSWLQIIRLSDGKEEGRYPLPAEQSRGGDFRDGMVVVYDQVFSTIPKVRIFAVGPDRLVPAAVWVARTSSGRNEPLQSARFLADGKVVTESQGELIVWSTNPVRPLYCLDNGDPQWRLASDRRHALVENNGQKFEVDLIEGKCTGIPGPGVPGPGGRLAGVLSPEGKQKATLQGQSFFLLGPDDAVREEFHIPMVVPAISIDWIDENTVRLQAPNRTCFVDVRQRVAFLEVLETPSGSSLGAGNGDPGDGWLTREERDERGQHFTVVQHRDAPINSANIDLNRYRQSVPPDPQSLLLLKRGDEVRLNVHFDVNPSLADDAQRKVRELLRSRGVKVTDTARDEVRLRSESFVGVATFAQAAEMQRNALLGRPAIDPSAINTMELLRDGNVVWSVSSGVKIGQNTNPGIPVLAALQAASQPTIPPEQFWSSLRLPELIAIHPQGNAWTRVLKSGQGLQTLGN